LPAELVKEAAKIDPHDEALYCLVHDVRDLGPTALRFSSGSLKSLLADLDRGHETRLRLPSPGVASKGGVDEHLTCLRLPDPRPDRGPNCPLCLETSVRDVLRLDTIVSTNPFWLLK
jgi:hypothetical protein